MTRTLSAASLSLLVLSLGAGCAMQGPTPSAYSQATLPDAVKVPAGHRVVMETVGVGEITYECRDKANTPGAHEWAFIGPSAALNDRGGQQVGKYFGPPATWQAMDGSRITGTQVAVAPAEAGSIPLQLVKANPAVGEGKMNGVSYVQRVATRGGVAPAMACDATSKGRRETVRYQADYIFYRQG
jgi:hypothetical protein